MRTAWVVAFGLLAASPLPSVAAPRTSCPLVVDATGDAVDPEGSPASDVVSVDLASDRTTMTVAVGYRDDDPVGVPTKGHQYLVELSTGESSYQVNAGVTSTGAWFELRRGETSAGGGSRGKASTWKYVASLKGVVDRSRHRVVMSFPLSLTDGEISPRRRVTAWAITVPGVGITTLPAPASSDATAGGATGVWGVSSDDTDVSQPYVVGARGCLAP